MLAEKLAHQLSENDERILLDVAEQSIRNGLKLGHFCEPHIDWYPVHLRRTQGSFVKLLVDSQLRGCVGSAEPQHPLLCDIAQNAYGAAFYDTRFPALSMKELEKLTIEVSVLNLSEHFVANSVEDIAQRLHPGADGIFLRRDNRTSAAMPNMWHCYAKPNEFAQAALKCLGVEQSEWPTPLQADTYTTQTFSRNWGRR